jgi:hypothetical protein
MIEEVGIENCSPWIDDYLRHYKEEVVDGSKQVDLSSDHSSEMSGSLSNVSSLICDNLAF